MNGPENSNSQEKPGPFAAQLHELHKIAVARRWQASAALLARYVKVWVNRRKGGYRIATLKEAEEEGLKIIRCSKCNDPALILDTFHPYENQYTLCVSHSKDRKL